MTMKKVVGQPAQMICRLSEGSSEVRADEKMYVKAEHLHQYIMYLQAQSPAYWAHIMR